MLITDGIERVNHFIVLFGTLLAFNVLLDTVLAWGYCILTAIQWVCVTHVQTIWYTCSTGCINHGNFCLEQGIKFCNIYKLFENLKKNI